MPREPILDQELRRQKILAENTVGGERRYQNRKRVIKRGSDRATQIENISEVIHYPLMARVTRKVAPRASALILPQESSTREDITIEKQFANEAKRNALIHRDRRTRPFPPYPIPLVNREPVNRAPHLPPVRSRV
jgi:hypothetical protein